MIRERDVGNKKLLLSAGDGDYEWYVEKTPNGNKYYQLEYKFDGNYSPNDFTPVSKKDMKYIVHREVEAYGFAHTYKPGDEDENMERIREFAPELLPDSVTLSDNKDSLRVIQDQSFCPEGYIFVKAYRKLKNGRMVRGYCRKDKDKEHHSRRK